MVMYMDLAAGKRARGMPASARGGQTGASSTTPALLTGKRLRFGLYSPIVHDAGFGVWPRRECTRHAADSRHEPVMMRAMASRPHAWLAAVPTAMQTSIKADADRFDAVAEPRQDPLSVSSPSLSPTHSSLAVCVSPAACHGRPRRRDGSLERACKQHGYAARLWRRLCTLR